MKNIFGFLLLALAVALPGAAAGHSRLGEIEVYDRTAGRTLDVYHHDGRRYVVGEPGHEYQVVLRNHSNRRVLAVTSVDGVNVITGETASTEQSGYVLSPWDSLEVSGWRKSMDEVAAFYFTPHRNSYAARTGRPFDVGVIGVALFREKSRFKKFFGLLEQDRLDDRGAGAPEAAEPEAAPDASAPETRGQRKEKLGTGHGRRERDEARYTEFVRASDSPDEVLTIYYDSRANLVAQGVIPRDRDVAQRRPDPFPGGFVPDP